MSELGSFPDPETIRFERVLGARPERVWEFLTEPELFSEWLGTGRIATEVGGKVDLQTGGGPVVRGKVLAVEMPRLLEFTWQVFLPGLPIPIGEGSVLRFELAPRGDETALVMIQCPVEKDYLTRSAAGWHGLLDMLAAQISGNDAPDLVGIFNSVLPEYEKLAG